MPRDGGFCSLRIHKPSVPARSQRVARQEGASCAETTDHRRTVVIYGLSQMGFNGRSQNLAVLLGV
jgi:hypothetical protein